MSRLRVFLIGGITWVSLMSIMVISNVGLWEGASMIPSALRKTGQTTCAMGFPVVGLRTFS